VSGSGDLVPTRGALAGQVAIVTGAARGIGERVARFLADDGAAVVVVDIDGPGSERVAESLASGGSSSMAIALDVADADGARRMAAVVLDRLGRIDILVNNAGIDAPEGLPWALSDDDWRRVIDVNLSGQWWCSQAVIPTMMQRRSGRIIFISSVSARMGEHGLSVAYNAAKAGLLGLTVGLATNLEPHGILVNAIAPGPTGNTGRPMNDVERELYENTLPLGLGGPVPIAQAVLFLARPSGDWVSGSVLNISGGLWKG
jgi:3-oxoacyl-[acyl-carrier protein] reductase